MIKVKEFSTKENYEVDEQVNDFIEENKENIRVIDAKYNSFLDSYHNIIMSFILLIYEEKESE